MIFYLIEDYLMISLIIIIIKVCYYSKESGMRLAPLPEPSADKIKWVCHNIRHDHIDGPVDRTSEY